MVEVATGVVLRTRPLTETSLIVHWLTRTLGRVATVAKGARRPKSPFQGKLDLFYLADFSFSRSRHSELHNLREVNVRETHPFLRKDLSYLQQAAYCARLLEQTTETETPLDALFEQFLGLLGMLSACPPQPQTIFAFELQLLRELGLQPNPSESRLTPGAQALFRHLAESDWSTISRLKLIPAQQSEIAHFLQRFLEFHIDRIPKGREAAIRIS